MINLNIGFVKSSVQAKHPVIKLNIGFVKSSVQTDFSRKARIKLNMRFVQSSVQADYATKTIMYLNIGFRKVVSRMDSGILGHSGLDYGWILRSWDLLNWTMPS